jgi:carbonic anhydrase
MFPLRRHLALSALLLASFALSSAAEETTHQQHWGYEGKAGPEHWADFGAACAGRNQSPIDLRNFIEAELPPIVFDYAAGGSAVVNNGHSIQVDYNTGSSISIDSIVFGLKQFHFHAPSENRINGKSFPVEIHFVHADVDGNLAVIALMLEEGDENSAFDKLWARMPTKEGERHLLSPAVAAADLLPANRDYYRYEGSLTTPPCSEGVRWLVLKQPVPVSAKQIDELTKRLVHPNNRPVQALGARVVLQ